MCAREGLSLQFVHLYPVDFHLYGVFLRAGFSYPTAFYLHVDEQVGGLAEGILPALVGIDARIGERLGAVDGEYQAVGQIFHRVGVEFARRMGPVAP